MSETLEYRAYFDPSHLASEVEHVFGSSWQYAGNVHELNDREAVPRQLVGLPIVLTRLDDSYSALVNVCAHRGSIVCREPTKGSSITCPYHAWRYDLSGSLLNAPRSAREPAFDAGAHSLEQLPIGLWGPFIFVATSADVIEFDEFLGELPEKVRTAGVEVESLEHHSRVDFELHANWKVCVENFLECYHCRIAHPSFAQAIDTSADGYELEPGATFSTQYGPVRASTSGDYELEGPVGRGQFHLLYPNTALNIMPGQPNISIGPINPDGPVRTQRFLDYFFGPDVDESWIGPMMEFDDRVGTEDRVLVEDMQRGLMARPDRRGTLFMDSERLIAHFEDYLRSRLPSEKAPG